MHSHKVRKIRCRVTNVRFQFAFNTGISEGIHPLVFSYSYPQLVRILGQVLDNPKLIVQDHLFLSRLSVLYYLESKLGVQVGNVLYLHGDDQDYNPSLENLHRDIGKNLRFFNEDIPELNEFRLKNIPCKGTVESLQDMFYTYQSGRDYTPFKRYLQGTLLSDKAIEAIVNYDSTPNQTTLMLLQLALSGQEHILTLSDRAEDFYNNRKMLSIKKKLHESSIVIPEDISQHVQSEDHRADRLIRNPKLKIKISPK